MEQPAQVQLTVIGQDGAPYFRGTVPDAASANPTIRGPQRVTFEVPPGRVQVKYAIRDASESTLDTDIRELTVPDLAAPEVGLSTPGVFRARTGPEAQTILNDPNAVPVVAREFRRTERLIVRAQAYGPGTEVPAVTARLLNRVGTAMQDLPVTLDQQTGVAQVDLPLSGIAPGEYRSICAPPGRAAKPSSWSPSKSCRDATAPAAGPRAAREVSTCLISSRASSRCWATSLRRPSPRPSASRFAKRRTAAPSS